MKKIAAIFLILSLLAGITGCGNKETPSNANNTSNTTTTANTNNTAATNNETATEVQNTEPAEDAEAPFDPFGYYEETVPITQTRILATWMGFDEGDNEDNNWWTRTYKERLNIELTNLFTAPNWGPEFDAKINIAFATDDLPDVMPLYTTLAIKAIQGNKIMDIAEAYDKYASAQVKELFAQDPMVLKAWTIDGKLYGLSNPKAVESWSYLWIPQSWLDELNGGAVPTTFEGLEALALKVVEKTGSYAIGFDSELSKLEDILYAYHGTYQWIEKDGKLVWGKVQPEVQEMWSKLAEWYEKGIIARDFANKSQEDLEADFLNGKFGMFVDTTNMPNSSTGRNWIKLNENDNLVCIPLMSVNGNDLKIVKKSGYDDALMVSAKCKYPDAVMRMYNLGTAISNDYGKPDYIKDTEYNTTKDGNMGWWNRLATGSGYVQDVIPEHQAGYLAAQAINSGSDGSELRSMNAFSAIETFDYINAWLKNGSAAENWDLAWSLWNMEMGAKSVPHSLQKHKEGKLLSTPKWGPQTEAEAENNQNLYAKYIEFATLAIMQNDVQNKFNEWINYYNANGGSDIDVQVNQWYDQNK